MHREFVTPGALQSRQHQRQHQRLTVVKTRTARGGTAQREEVVPVRSPQQTRRPRDDAQDKMSPRHLRAPNAVGIMLNENPDLVTYGVNHHIGTSHTVNESTPAKTSASASIRFLEEKQQQKLQQQRENVQGGDISHRLPWKRGGLRWSSPPPSVPRQRSSTRHVPHPARASSAQHRRKPQVGACSGFGAAWKTDLPKARLA